MVVNINLNLIEIKIISSIKMKSLQILILNKIDQVKNLIMINVIIKSKIYYLSKKVNNSLFKIFMEKKICILKLIKK